MKNLAKSLGLAALWGALTISEVQAYDASKTPADAYLCEAKYGEGFESFELSLLVLSPPRCYNCIRYAMVVTPEDAAFDGSFTTMLISDGTRLAGMTEYGIKVTGSLGSINLNLIKNRKALFGSGKAHFDGVESTIIVNCKLK